MEGWGWKGGGGLFIDGVRDPKILKIEPRTSYIEPFVMSFRLQYL
jgi:hypothetical protein